MEDATSKHLRELWTIANQEGDLHKLLAVVQEIRRLRDEEDKRSKMEQMHPTQED